MAASCDRAVKDWIRINDGDRVRGFIHGKVNV